MRILSQLAVTQAAALASSTIGRFDFFVDISDGKLKAYNSANALEDVGGASTAQEVSYALTVPADWDGTPANAQAALDELASRVKGIEGKTDFITITAAIDLDDVKSKADSALQSGDNISELLNDAGYTGPESSASIKTKYESNANTNGFTDSEKTKLSGLESSKFVGEFISLSALQTAFPTASVGSYAYVDTGVGVDVQQYIWDDTDSDWIAQQGQSTAETPASIKSKYESNADTNAFTDSEKQTLVIKAERIQEMKQRQQSKAKDL